MPHKHCMIDMEVLGSHSISLMHLVLLSATVYGWILGMASHNPGQGLPHVASAVVMTPQCESRGRWHKRTPQTFWFRTIVAVKLSVPIWLSAGGISAHQTCYKLYCTVHTPAKPQLSQQSKSTQTPGLSYTALGPYIIYFTKWTLMFSGQAVD